MTGQRATETAENKQFPSRGALTSLLLLEPPTRLNMSVGGYKLIFFANYMAHWFTNVLQNVASSDTAEACESPVVTMVLVHVRTWVKPCSLIKLSKIVNYQSSVVEERTFFVVRVFSTIPALRHVQLIPTSLQLCNLHFRKRHRSSSVNIFKACLCCLGWHS